MLKKFNDLTLRAAVRLAVLRNTMRDERGISIVELLVILGVAVILILIVKALAQPTIDTWWNNKIAPQFS
jgi:Flp pilus assembly pilin Flp